MLTRRALAAAAVAASLAGVTALTPVAQAAPREQAAPRVQAAVIAAGRPVARPVSRISPFAWPQLLKDLRAAWQITHGEGATVAFVGTGINPSTPGLVGKVTVGPSYGHAPGFRSNPLDSLIASAVAGQGPSSGNPYGTIGLAPRARVLSLQLASIVPDHTWEANEARAIRYAARHGAQVIYLDLSSPNDDTGLDSAVQYALARNVVVVASGFRWPGLSKGTAMFPNSLPGVLTGLAVPVTGEPATCSGSYSAPPRGSALVAAPARDILATSAGGNLYSLCYYAAADVWLTSTAVLIKAVFPRLAPSLVAQAIAMSARDQPRGFSPAIGFGMINPVGALHLAASLQHAAIAARPGPGSADPAARLGGGPAPGPVRAVRHSPLLLGACGGAVAAGALLLVAVAVAARRRRQARVRIS